MKKLKVIFAVLAFLATATAEIVLAGNPSSEKKMPNNVLLPTTLNIETGTAKTIKTGISQPEFTFTVDGNRVIVKSNIFTLTSSDKKVSSPHTTTTEGTLYMDENGKITSPELDVSFKDNQAWLITKAKLSTTVNSEVIKTLLPIKDYNIPFMNFSAKRNSLAENKGIVSFAYLSAGYVYITTKDKVARIATSSLTSEQIKEIKLLAGRTDNTEVTFTSLREIGKNQSSTVQNKALILPAFNSEVSGVDFVTTTTTTGPTGAR